MTVDPILDNEDVSIIVCNMWAKLAQTFEEAAHAAFIDGKPDEALRNGARAEACYWRAMGESDCIDLKDVVRLQPGQSGSAT